MALGRKNPGVFTYFGSKRNIANILASKLKNDCQPVCEVFAGGAFLTLRLAAWRAVREVWLNDLDPGVAALWRVIRSKLLVSQVVRRLPRATTRTLYHEAVGDLAAAQVDVETADNDTLVELAWKKAVSVFSSFGGIGICYGFTRYPTVPYMAARLMQGHDLLKRVGVRVTNWDFGRVLDEAGSYTLYLDPPYWHVRGGYMKDFKGGDHTALALRLWDRDRWLLSYDDCRGVRALYHWANIDEISLKYSCTSGVRWGKELLISPKD
jgi:DNA adenine methylase